MTDRSAYEVVASHNGLSGLGIIEFEGQHRSSSNPFAAFFPFFTVRRVPKEPDSRVMVVLDDIFFRRSLGLTPLGALASDKEAFEQLGLYAIGQYLDTSGMPPFTPSGIPATEVDANRDTHALYERRRPQASDADVLAYAASKIFWGWRFGLTQVRFSPADHLRLAVPQGDIERVALAGDGRYWTRIEGARPAFSPTSKLIQDLPAGRIPGLERSPVFQVQAKLRAPRYAAAAEHFSKAIDFLTGPSQDLANSAKEAIMAVESLAMLVTGRTKGTLGDCIKDLRSRGDLSSPLDRVFEALWGYASEEPGVRHGKPSPPSLAERDATLGVNLAASVVLFLLDLDSLSFLKA
jgi:hypothetical protein